MDIQLSQHYLLKRLFIPLLNRLGTLIENQLTINERVHFWTLNSILLFCISLFMPAQHSLDYYSFVVNFKIEKCVFFNSVLFQDCLAILGPLKFPKFLKDHLSLVPAVRTYLLVEASGVGLQICQDYHVGCSLYASVLFSLLEWTFSKPQC